MPDPGARHPWFNASGSPRILAHRGLVTAELASQGVVENSFAAIAAAHAAGAVYIESDCHLTSDGHVVLLHDADLSRVAGNPALVAETPLRELEKIMAPLGGVITLRQALDAFPDVRFNIDVKADAAAVPTGRVVAPHAERVLLTSFSDARRATALASAAETRAGALPATSAGRETILRLVWAASLRSNKMMARALHGVDALQIPERHGRVGILSPRVLDAAHAAGVEVHIWTVNEPAELTRLRDLGVDGVVTDRADLALRMFPVDRG
ncbi:glycerophosphodiester phosphodiesterase family protein [Microbacterium sp. C7(2022)]|uniref:glycerophosphodiester phosphodiesterase family protein n=1 Tax=Microbacterium sp. C7(2022) TaxID=2992759 RepID=UPI00237A4CD3|nr:glycerophosphodiester phosphodiesterase family protein [Microbacterium sp. C7(2022)]MDE0545590.1 glycerophosphodiester phosphodiesterase family protein [Microbacterium sp. C7(2022)]